MLPALLLLSGAVAVFAQKDGSGSIAGRLTDLYSRPLASAGVTLRNTRSGLAVHTVTERNGAYRFAGLIPGEYSLEAESPQLGYGRLQGILISAGHEARVQAAISLTPRAEGSDPAGLDHSASRSVPPLQAGEPSSAQRIMAVAGDAGPPTSVRNSDAPPLSHREIESGLSSVPIEAINLTAKSAVVTSSKQAPGNGLVQSSETGTIPAAGNGLGSEGAARQNPALQPETHANPTELSWNNELAAVLKTKGSEAETAEAETSATVAGAGPDLAPRLAAEPGGAAIPMVGAGLARRETGFAMAAICGLQAQLQAVWPSHRNIELAAGAATDGENERVRGEELQQLPLAGRHWEDFVPDRQANQAGAVQGDAGVKDGSLNAGWSGNAITVDAASTQLAFGGRRGSQGLGSSLMGPGRSESAIREVETANVGAEGIPGRTEIGTSKGARGLHGKASIVDRQNLWGAQNPFTTWVKETPAATPGSLPGFTSLPYTAADRDMTWGVGVGGAMGKKRMFWFGALDGADRNNPGVATVRHPENFFAQPSNDEMQVLSARLQLSSVDPVDEGLAAYSGMLAQLAGLLGPAARSSKQWVGFGRLDWEGAERHRVMLEGTRALWNALGGGLTRASEAYGNHSFGVSHASETWMLGRWEAFLTPNLLAVTQGSMGRHILTDEPEAPSTLERSMLASAWGQLPQIVVDSRYGFTMGNPARFGPGSSPDEHLYEAQESSDWVRGNLLVRTGFDVRHNVDSTGFVRNHLGTFAYSRVENFISDALVFAKYGLAGALDPMDQHNCDQRGRAWRDANGQLHGLGYLPCYSYYTQTMGPTDWHLSTNDWAGFATAQWQPAKRLVVSAGLRWEHEDLPPPIAKAMNPELALTGRLPSLGSEWGPRASVAWGSSETRWPVVRGGYGMYFGRTQNSVLETVLTQTGSQKGDLNFFMKPVDNLTAGGAPPFPYVLTGEPTTVVKPGAVQMAPGFRNPEVHQGEVAVEEKLPGKVEMTATALMSLGRHLPVTADTNLDPVVNPGTITYAVVDASGKGPLQGHVTVPFFASWPVSATGGRLHANYQQISTLTSRANSTYEAAMLRIARTSRRGLSLNARYTYSHAMDWNPNETTQISGGSMLDPTNFALEYGTSNLDVRHSASASVIWQAPWRVRNLAGQLVNGWMLSAIGNLHSGLPFTMRTAGSITEEFESTGAVIAGLGTGMNGSGGDDRVYGVGRNTYRYPMTWKADVRVGKTFDLGRMREVQVFAESFNLFNHQNVTLLETTGYYITPGGASGTMPILNFLSGLKAGQTEFGKPLDVNATDFFRPRQIDFGMRLRF
jgi:hypothetical protein